MESPEIARRKKGGWVLELQAQDTIARIFIVMTGLLLHACAARMPFVDLTDGGCAPGKECVLHVTLLIGDSWSASIEKPNSCVALAVPDSITSEVSSLDEHMARISGVGYKQPGVDDEEGQVSYGYLVRGMRVNTNFCDETAVIVESIVLDNGRTWIGKTQHLTSERPHGL